MDHYIGEGPADLRRVNESKLLHRGQYRPYRHVISLRHEEQQTGNYIYPQKRETLLMRS